MSYAFPWFAKIPVGVSSYFVVMFKQILDVKTMWRHPVYFVVCSTVQVLDGGNNQLQTGARGVGLLGPLSKHIRTPLKQPILAEIKQKTHEVFIFSMSDAKLFWMTAHSWNGSVLLCHLFIHSSAVRLPYYSLCPCVPYLFTAGKTELHFGLSPHELWINIQYVSIRTLTLNSADVWDLMK